MKKLISSLIKLINRLLFRSRLDDRSRTRPVNDNFGYRRGTPIDRFYIEQALESYSKYIKGPVLEVGGRDYTEQFGNVADTDSYILNFVPMEGRNIIVGDLADYSSVNEKRFQTFICTQTMNFIYDFRLAFEASFKILDDGGYFLGTVASVSNISKYDDSRWGDYWRFTRKSMEKVLLDSKFEIIDLREFGNVLAAKAMFDGLVVQDFDKQELLNIHDSGYPVIISFLCRKPAIDG